MDEYNATLTQSLQQYDQLFQDKAAELKKMHDQYYNDIQANRQQILEITHLTEMEKATEEQNADGKGNQRVCASSSAPKKLVDMVRTAFLNISI